MDWRTEPPQWALDRVIEITNKDGSTYKRETFAQEAPGTSIGKAFARYIAAHEDPPVDPLREEAIAIVLAEAVTRTDNQIAAIRSGQAGDVKVDLVLTALKRGIELAKDTQP